MSSKSTWFWVASAAALFAFIFFFERHLQKPPSGPMPVLPHLAPAAVTGIQVLPKGQLEIRAERTNGVWRLTSPIRYPARPDRIQNLLDALAALKTPTFITAQELKNVPQADERYGFDPPQNTLVLRQGDEQTFVHLGFRTAPGDEVFVQVVGIGEVFVVDADLLKLLPSGADDWRDPRLVDLTQVVADRLYVTNAGKAFELRHNNTNRLWRIILPGWETRADSDKVKAGLSRLQDLRALHYVSDDPRADLDAFGLQAPELSLTLAQGTNTVLQLFFGKSPTNDTAQIYARRSDESSVITVSKDLLGPWRGSYDAFRDRHLVTMTQLPDSIEIRTEQDQFTVEREAGRGWRVEPGDIPADPGLVENMLRDLGSLQVSEIVKDVVTAPDLAGVGLSSPSREFTLMTAVTNAAGLRTNSIMAQLDFGTNQDDKVYARRTDESSLYTVPKSDLARLPLTGWQMRSRRIWNFDSTNVAGIAIREGDRAREIVRHGPNKWSLAPGSQGIINDLAMDEVAHQLGNLSADRWVAHGDTSLARYGISTNSLRIVVELKSGARMSVTFGATTPSGSTCAVTTLDNQPWVFEVPWRLYNEYVQPYLTIPVYLH